MPANRRSPGSSGQNRAACARDDSFYVFCRSSHPRFRVRTLLLLQRFDDGVEGLLDDLFRLELSQPNLVRYGLDYLFLGHDADLLLG